MRNAQGYFMALAVGIAIAQAPRAFGQNGANPNEPQNRGSGPMKEFVTACTYGVLAGTLVGTATLAFEDKPGDNLQNVARGASIGLYSGILLGLYVVYIVPDQMEKEKMRMYEDQGLPPPESSRLQVLPLISDRGIEGAFAQYKAFSF
ncbi:MAG: hypothetical protein IPK68_22895 [Bdellovibrionales bacterium]|nr:hypothetical protein [Bdellovibrionales bacterium]